MLEYYHSYNTEYIDKPYNIACIASDASNVALYVNDEFKTTLQPNVNSTGSSYPIVYKPMISNDLLAKLLIKGTLEANYDLNTRKSIFNDKNYCQIAYDITKPTDADNIVLEVNSSCSNEILGDNDYDYYSFTITKPANYTLSLDSNHNSHRALDIFGAVNATAYSYSRGTISISRFLPVGQYLVRFRCGFTYGSTVYYTVKLVESGKTATKVIPTYSPRYYLTNNNGSLSFSPDKASKFYFDPKIFNFKDLYLKLFGSLPLDTKLNNLYLSSQQQAIINTKVVYLGTFTDNFLAQEALANLFNYSVAKLEDDLFSLNGLLGYIKLSSIYSLDSWATYGDKVKLVSNKETLEFDYLPVSSSSYELEYELPTVTDSKILHIGLKVYSPNKRVLLSYALTKGTQTIDVNYAVTDNFNISFSHTITRL